MTSAVIVQNNILEPYLEQMAEELCLLMEE
jgi:hypothetical protein